MLYCKNTLEHTVTRIAGWLHMRWFSIVSSRRHLTPILLLETFKILPLTRHRAEYLNFTTLYHICDVVTFSTRVLSLLKLRSACKWVPLTGTCAAGWLDACSTWPVHLSSSIHQCSSLLYSNLAVLQQFVQVGLMILRAVVRGAIQWVSNLHLLDLFHLTSQGWGNK